MNLVILLHLYQPHNQQLDILERIVHECYSPLIQGLIARPHAKICLNVSGVLLELFAEHGYEDLLQGLEELSRRKQVEFTGSAMYHAFLPLLPVEEMKRQILLHQQSQAKYLNKSMSSQGFFSPELAVSQQVLNICSTLSYKWIAAEELALPNPDSSTLYKDKESSLVVLPRNKRVSSLILSASVTSPQELKLQTQDIYSENGYWFVVMDAETFGHHRVGHEKFLFELLDSNVFNCITPTELISNNLPIVTTEVRPCTWSNNEQDFWLDQERTMQTNDRAFLLWKDPGNPIHQLQWELTNLVLGVVHQCHSLGLNGMDKSRSLLDAALASDQYWWASAKPWWSLEMLEQGAHALVQVLHALPEYDKKHENIQNADILYRKILDKAFEWQRTGHIRQAHLANSGTFMQKPLKERTHAEWFNQIVLEFEYEMNAAASRHNYEQAIKWRDAIKKIKLGSDKYDVLHVVDELWSGRTVPWASPLVKPFLEHSWEEFSDFAKEHFLNITCKEDFESWKSKKKSDTL